MTPEAERLVKALKCCGAKGRFLCEACPFANAANEGVASCQAALHKEAAELIETAESTADEQRKRRNRAIYERYRETKIRYLKKLHDERRSAGLCIKCGAPAKEGSCHCEACMKYNRDYMREWYRKHKEAKKVEK